MANDGCSLSTSRRRPADRLRPAISERAQHDAATILRARALEDRALALLQPALDAHPDNAARPLSPGLRAELARRISGACPAARALLAEADALLYEVIGTYEGILRRRAERWARMTGLVAADPDDLAAAARLGCWRGLIRWRPDGGSNPLHFALQWAESAAQRDNTTTGDMTGGLSTGSRSRGWSRPAETLARARLDAPAPSNRDGRILLHSVIAAPCDGDDLDTQIDLYRVGVQLQARIDALPERSREILRFHLSDDAPTLQDIALRFGISRQRVQQLRAEALHAIAPDHYPAPPARTEAGGPPAADPALRGVALRVRLLDLARERPGLTTAEAATILNANWASVRPMAAVLRADGLLLPHDDHRPGIYPTPGDAPATRPAQPRGTVIDAVRAALTADPAADLPALAAQIGTTTKSVRATASLLRARGHVPKLPKQSDPGAV